MMGSVLFGPYIAMAIICLGTGIGASFSFLLSSWLAGPLFNNSSGSFLQHRFDQLRLMFGRRDRKDQFSILLFLRITPVCPNWAINLCAPHLGLDLGTFFLGTAIGVAALGFIHVQIGQTLRSSLYDADAGVSIFTLNNAILVTVSGMLSLLPLLAQRQ